MPLVPKRTYVIGPAAGRGPGEGCGVIAELVLAGEERARRLHVLELCLPCSSGAQPHPFAPATTPRAA